MKKERKNEMKKMIADFLINEIGNPRLEAIKNIDRKAFYDVVFKMREHSSHEPVYNQCFYRKRQEQMRHKFMESLAENADTNIPSSKVEDNINMEPSDHYRDACNARKAAIIDRHNRLKPVERESQLSAIGRDINQVNISTDVSSGTMYSKALGIYDITKQVLDGIKIIKDNFNDGYERCAFSSALGLLSFICTEYGKLANDIFNTGIREKWALDELGPLNDTLCKKWNGVKAPLEDDKQDEKVESDVAEVDDILPDGKAWETKPMRLFISQPFTGKTEEEIFNQREEVVAAVKEIYKGATIEVIDQYHQECDVDRRLHHLAESIKLMDSADLIYFTSDWKSAPGCRIEYAIATEYGFNIAMDEPKRIE